MRVGIYTPYLDTLGGGEKYMMTIAEVLSKIAEVDLLLNSELFPKGESLKKVISKRFDLDLNKVNTVHAPIGPGSNFIKRFFFLDHYDVLFYLTDGSIFYPSARHNFLHIQSPLVGQPARSIWGKLKLNGWDCIIYNSEFTKQHSEKNWPLRGQVVYPPVDTEKIKPMKKKKIILSVGRFFGFLREKKQSFLIEAFGRLSKEKKLKDWTLYLAGSAGPGDEDYLEELKRQAKGLDVEFYPNISYEDLLKLYGESSIYWHAMGYKEEDTTKMEHFGITTVEAMAAGCVPVVINKGGQTEIVENGKSGFVWNSVEELIGLTSNLIENRKLLVDISPLAIERANQFSKNQFEKEILELVNER